MRNFIYILVLLLCTQAVFAWDDHHLITRSALIENQKLQSKLVEVRSIENFIQEAFPGCNQDDFFEHVLEGVGENYKVEYVQSVDEKLRFSDDLFQIDTELIYHPSQCQPDANCLESASHILSVYSDEPDWNIDRDVSRLKDTGLTKGVNGTGSQLLRHFWFDPEMYYNEGIETPYHAQRLLEVSLAAFASGHEYWGFRFLGHAIHYLQDLTQPFHVEPVPSLDMPRTWELLSASLCDKMKKDKLKNPDKYLDPNVSKGCNEKSLTYAQAMYLSGVVVTTYHTIYETYARELFFVPNYQMEQKMSGVLSAFFSFFNKFINKTVLIDRSPIGFINDQGEINYANFIIEVARRTRELNSYVGDDTYSLFGGHYRSDIGIKKVLTHPFDSENPGYKAAHGIYRKGRKSYKDRLDGITQDLLAWSGELTRATVNFAMTVPSEVKRDKLIQFQKLCEK